MPKPIDLYYFPVSPPCRRVLLVGKILGINFNQHVVNILEGENLTPEFLKMNPEHTVPTMNDNGLIIWESRPLMAYLISLYAKDEKTASLYPKDPRKRVVVDQCLYFDCNLFENLLVYYEPILKGIETKPDELKKMKFLQSLSTLEKFLETDDWVAGDEITIADISILVTVNTAEAIGINPDKYEKISSWLDRVRIELAPYGYDEIEKIGMTAFGQFFNSRLNN